MPDQLTKSSGSFCVEMMTPIIEAVFGVLDPVKTGTNHNLSVYSFLADSAGGGMAWSKLFVRLEAYMERMALKETKTPLRFGQAPFISIVTIAEHFNVDPEVTDALLRSFAFSEDFTFENLLDLVRLFDDGHGFEWIHDEKGGVVISENSTWFRGEGHCSGAHATVRLGSMTAVLLGKRLNEHLKLGDIDTAAAILFDLITCGLVTFRNTDTASAIYERLGLALIRQSEPL